MADWFRIRVRCPQCHGHNSRGQSLGEHYTCEHCGWKETEQTKRDLTR